jgi:hypothetical protein
MPVARLIRLALNGKSPKARHDAAYYALEASIRLAVAACPPADARGLAVPSAGHFVAALPHDRRRQDDPALLALFSVLAEVVQDRPAARASIGAHELLALVPGYRNKVVGHGSLRPDPFYARAGEALVAGVRAAWARSVFFPAGARLVIPEAVEVAADGSHAARLLEVWGLRPVVEGGGGLVPVPPTCGRGASTCAPPRTAASARSTRGSSTGSSTATSRSSSSTSATAGPSTSTTTAARR